MTDDPLEVILPVQTLTQYLTIQATAADECVLEFGRDGLASRMVDPANVMLADVSLDAGAFESVGEGKMRAGVDIDRLLDHLGFGESGDLARLTFDTETGKIDLTVGGHYSASVAMIDPDSIRNKPDIPDLEDGQLPNEITLPGRSFSTGVDAADLVSDHAAIEGDEESGVAMTADGDIEENRYAFDGDGVEAHVPSEERTLLSTEYLQDITAELPGDADVTIRFGTEFPVFIEWDFADGEGEVFQMIAPRISSQ
jgi:proliferating cell nuclear antigen